MIKPLGDRVLAEYEKTTEKTASGIFLPTENREKTEFAKIIELGETISQAKLKKGDRVIFREYAAQDITVDGKKFAIIKEEDILAKVEK